MGAAQELVGEHETLDPDEVIQRSLPDEQDREHYQEMLQRAADVVREEGTTKSHFYEKGRGYSAERRRLHNEIVKAILAEAPQSKPEPGKKPEFVILGGRSGSGKSNFDQKNNRLMGVYDREHFVRVDADDIKRRLPGYSPFRAAQYHEESADIAWKALTAARRSGVSTVLDTTLSGRSHVETIRQYKGAGYDTSAYYMARPMRLAAESAVKRAVYPSDEDKANGFDHGRLVPIPVLLSQRKNERHFDQVSRHVDRWELWGNPHAGHHGITKVAEGENRAVAAARRSSATSSAYRTWRRPAPGSAP